MSARRTPGPSPEPIELRKVKGNPGKRAMPKDAPEAPKPSRTPPVPAYLKPAGRAAWTTYWTNGKAWLSLADVPMIARLCRLIDKAEVMEQTLEKEGLVHQNKETERSSAHYLLSQLLGLYKTIGELEFDAGFRPAARSRLKTEAAPEDAVAAWEASA